jgi:hypothetical protein
MQSRVQRFVADTGANRETIIKDMLNEELADVAGRYRWRQLRRLVETGIGIVAGQAYLFLPKDVAQVTMITDQESLVTYMITDGAGFTERTVGLLSTRNTPQLATAHGQFAQKSPIALAEALEIFSTSAGDTSQDVAVNVLVAGEPTRAFANLNGTSAVSLGVTPDAGLSILSFSSDTTSRLGVIKLRGFTSGTIYATLTPEDLAVSYPVYRIAPIPPFTRDLSVQCKLAVRPMVRDDDVPAIPVSRYLTEMVIGRIWEQMRKWAPGVQAHMQRCERILADLVAVHAHEGMVKQAIPANGAFGRRYLTAVRTLPNNG